METIEKNYKKNSSPNPSTETEETGDWVFFVSNPLGLCPHKIFKKKEV